MPPDTCCDTLILGLGNPILCDDRAGLLVARAVFDRLPRGSAALELAHVGGIELLHLLEGRLRVLLIDALEPGRLQPGEVVEVPLAELERRYAGLTPHNAGFGQCLALGRICGLAMPDEIRIFAIGIEDPYTFSERCTPLVERALPRIVELILTRVFDASGGWMVGGT